MKTLVFIFVILSVLTLSNCGENNGSVVTNPPPPVPGTIYPAPTPGDLPPFPTALPVPPPPSPGPVPYTPPVVSDNPAFAPTFTKINQTILQTSCVSCHSSSNSGSSNPGSANSGSSNPGSTPDGQPTPGSHPPAGGLDLTTYSGVLSKVVAGDPERSALYQYLRGAQMPPSGQLPEDQILAIQEWISAGAKNN